MKNWKWAILLLAGLFPALLYAQTDTVDVPDYFDSGAVEGTLNNAIAAKITAGTLSNTVFRLRSYGYYVLSSTITAPAGKKLTIIGPDPVAASWTVQDSATPMICWTPSTSVTRTFNFDCFGDIYMRNVWILYATTQMEDIGTQVGSTFVIDQDTTDDVNYGVFKNVIFDYAPIGPGGGSVSVQAKHARLSFENCYWRNCTDTHFRYYGRALSYIFGSVGWHVDSVSFVNTTFANMGYVLMQEGGEYADYVKFNHCTFLNTVMFTLESGWWWWLSVTNSVFVNAYMFGYAPAIDGSTPAGGALNIDSIGTSSFSFAVPFTESDRHIVFAHNSYFVEKWLTDYMAPYNPVTNPTGGNAYSNALINQDSVPRWMPYMSEKTKVFFNNKSTWPYISMKNVYDSTNPGILVPPTNQEGIKSYLRRKWTDNSDTTWAYEPHSDVNQTWPMGEQLRYSSSKVKTAGMGGFPLGDLYRWWNNIPTYYSNWKAQAATENQTITDWLTNGIVGVNEEAVGSPLEFELMQNYPNPFNPATQISYSIPQKSNVTLKVFNVLGMELATLFSGVQDAGEHTATFDATRFSSGVYFYRLHARPTEGRQAGSVSMTKKMLFMK